jgi:hypothetical protein
VVTPAVHAGLPEEILQACLVGETAEAFGHAIVRLLRQTPEQRRAMASVDFASLSWDRQLQPLLALLHDAAGAQSSSKHPG